MDTEYTNSLKISKSDLIEIYNTVPRTLFHSAIVVSVNQDCSFKQESSGNYWIIKIDNSTGWLFPKRGQIFDKYQYSTLQNLFNCSGHEQHSKKEFIIKNPAQVAFNIDKQQWYLEKQGVLEFGDNSLSTRLRKASNKLERLSFNSHQDKQEIQSLHNELQQSQYIATQRKTEIEELKINHTKLLDLFADLQRDKKHQKEINNNLSEINKKLSIDSNETHEKYLLNNQFFNQLKSRNNEILLMLQELKKNLNRQFISSSNKLGSIHSHYSNERYQRYQEKNTLDETSTYSSLSDFLENLVANYNKNPKNLAQNIVKVAATQESIEQRRSGIKTPLILKPSDNDSYWVVIDEQTKEGNYYVVPKANLIISHRIYFTVKYIFTCKGFNNKISNNFTLFHPAEVRFIKGDEYELLKPGELRFEEN
ncbi:MAG: hypothetical protein AAGE84_09540 [Cyanobacteria bacterium P01_G01_bin.39]